MKPPLRYLKFGVPIIGLTLLAVLTNFAVPVGLATATGSTTTTSTTTTTLSGTSTTTTLSGTSTTSTTLAEPAKVTNITWPAMGSAAVSVPVLSVLTDSPRQTKQPIASLTKMMTTWIVLHKFPLVPSQTGICETVTASDVATYNQDIVEEQSVAKVVQGENICERTLLRGIFVHSAGNYAQLLAQFTGLSTPQFVALMNSTAVSLGMMDTHYVDETGISSGDVSTAHDQMILTDDLMTNEPIVQSVAALTRVWLPVAGVVGTYTPFLGQDGVVGVKSGYTIAAGGCDVMAIGAMLGTTKVMTYIVVLGQKSANALFLAGKSALTIFRTIRPSIARVHTSAGIEIAWIGATDDVVSPPISLTK